MYFYWKPLWWWVLWQSEKKKNADRQWCDLSWVKWQCNVLICLCLPVYNYQRLQTEPQTSEQCSVSLVHREDLISLPTPQSTAWLFKTHCQPFKLLLLPASPHLPGWLAACSNFLAQIVFIFIIQIVKITQLNNISPVWIQVYHQSVEITH